VISSSRVQRSSPPAGWACSAASAVPVATSAARSLAGIEQPVAQHAARQPLERDQAMGIRASEPARHAQARVRPERFRVVQRALVAAARVRLEQGARAVRGEQLGRIAAARPVAQASHFALPEGGPVGQRVTHQLEPPVLLREQRHLRQARIVREHGDQHRRVVELERPRAQQARHGCLEGLVLLAA
jgi:hypothetical protein